MARPSSPRLCLVALTWTRRKDPRVPLGHASILAALRARDIEVVPLVYAVNEASGSIPAMAREILTAVGLDGDVAIGAYVWNEHVVQALLPALREAGHRGRILLGGPQISYAGAEIERLYPAADVFVRGHGESALVDLVERPDARIPGVHRRGEVDRGEQAQAALDTLPSPWLSAAVDIPSGGFVRMETQRGCPFRCSFCQHREAGGRLVRTDFALARVEAELGAFVAAGVREIAVLDPIFNQGPNALGVLGRLRELGYDGKITLQCRFELVTDAFLDACDGLGVVLEFGLQTIHPAESKVVERGNNLRKVEEVVAKLRARRLAWEVTLIFGLPEQTVESFRASVDFCLTRGVPVVRAFPLMLLRGTKLERERDRWALVESDDTIPMVVASSTFDREDWTRMATLAQALSDTEGRHPASVDALEHGGPVDRARWAPARLDASVLGA